MKAKVLVDLPYVGKWQDGPGCGLMTPGWWNGPVTCKDIAFRKDQIIDVQPTTMAASCTPGDYLYSTGIEGTIHNENREVWYLRPAWIEVLP